MSMQRNYGTEGPKIHDDWTRERTVPSSDTFSFTLSVDMYDSNGDTHALSDTASLARHTLGMVAYLADGTTVEPVFGTWEGRWQSGVRVTSQTADQFGLFEAIKNLAASINAQFVHTVRTSERDGVATTWWDTIADPIGRTIR